MHWFLRFTFVLAGLLPATAALADLKITTRSAGRALGIDAEGETVTYFKGGKMRTDTTGEGGKQFSTILDADSGQMISINHQKKTAEIATMREFTEAMRMVDSENIAISFEAKGEKKTIAGLSCERHDVTVKVPFMMAESERIDAVLSGPAWIAKDAPGAADYAAFYLAAAEKGLFFGPPAQARAQPGQAKAMTEMYRQFAKAGLSCASTIDMRFEGSGMMAAIMGKMKVTANTELTALSTDALSADLFAVPAGYKTRQGK